MKYNKWRKILYCVSIVVMTFGNLNEKKDVVIKQVDRSGYISNYEKNIQELTINQSRNKININKANSSELQKLYRVGPKTAEKIIQYRNENGEFKKNADIMKVKGVGPKTYEKMKEIISVK